MGSDMGSAGQETTGAGPPRGWFRRNWLWFVPTVVLSLIVLCVLVGGVVGYMVLIHPNRSSEPYQMALEQVRKDEQVVGRLGEPIGDIIWPPPAGNVFVDGDRGEAHLDFDVAGPNGKAHVRTQARRITSQWGLTTVEVTFDDNERVMLDTRTEGGPSEAPKWSP